MTRPIDFTHLISRSAEQLMPEAARLRDAGFDSVITYSRKVFIPLTHLCRDICSYCTFAHKPDRKVRAYLSEDEVLAIARAGAQAGCTEALFTLGDKPELRYKVARDELKALGADSTIAYLARVCERVLKETGLIPHVNPGVLGSVELTRLREVSASQGLMLESTADRLCERGGPHFGSPDKRPAIRLETLSLAGELRIPFTTGILIGIGETRTERLDALVVIRDLHARYGHIQEVIVQNFRAKPGTRMADAPHASHEELLWTIAAARLILGAQMSIQAPPNLAGEACGSLIDAGINDWGGVSPVTPDHVNPEVPWPDVEVLRRISGEHGKVLVERLPSYPRYVQKAAHWHAPALATALTQNADAEGYARMDHWSPGLLKETPVLARHSAIAGVSPQLRELVAQARAGVSLGEAGIVRLFAARDDDFHFVCEAADALRREVAGDTVRYVVNRNINYTNICAYRCTFCAFSKARNARSMRGEPYDLSLDEIERRVAEAWARGATEVCMQGGIHPQYDGRTYLNILAAVKRAAPD
ncbi:MAG TPA: 7,8-didemethyl-8-hydroxy-5-deazariboflavin synthase CofG, partial [Burkholderiales bacterium]|nr:7,8-didemethyl-8-hydroxy-5-deazariboflavin synthase CofG [Burkholderiales bacterium]